jgi:hypothetical protein
MFNKRSGELENINPMIKLSFSHHEVSFKKIGKLEMSPRLITVYNSNPSFLKLKMLNERS